MISVIERYGAGSRSVYISCKTISSLSDLIKRLVKLSPLDVKTPVTRKDSSFQIRHSRYSRYSFHAQESILEERNIRIFCDSEFSEYSSNQKCPRIFSICHSRLSSIDNHPLWWISGELTITVFDDIHELRKIRKSIGSIIWYIKKFNNMIAKMQEKSYYSPWRYLSIALEFTFPDKYSFQRFEEKNSSFLSILSSFISRTMSMTL